jgi:hypothetical protein
MIDELVEKYLIKKGKKERKPVDKIRKPTAPPSERHGDDKYSRKEKHKVSY